MQLRKAATLLEVLVVVAIVGILIALMLPAVQKVREAAARLKSMNNLRQCALALHHFSEANGKLPSLDGTGNPRRESLMFELLPYVEEDNYYRQYAATGAEGSAHTVRMFLSPADPTVELNSPTNNLSSYGANAFALQQKGCRLGTNFPDGHAQTIAFAEHYAWKCKGTQFSWAFASPVVFDNLPDLVKARRATFAEPVVLLSIPFGTPYPADVHPVTQGDPPATTGSEPGLTFQVRPTLEDCNPRLAQTPHAGGMLVALFDGSVRTLGPAMSPSTYWSAVTPAGGEVLRGDW